MSHFIKCYFPSSMLNMFWTLIHPSSGACDFSVVSPHWLRVRNTSCIGVSVWLVGAVSVWKVAAVLLQPSTRIHLIKCDIKLVSLFFNFHCLVIGTMHVGDSNENLK